MLVVELISHYIFDIRLLLQLRVCTRLKRIIDKYEPVAIFLKMCNGEDQLFHRRSSFSTFSSLWQPFIYSNNVGTLIQEVHKTYLYEGHIKIPRIGKVVKIHVLPDSYKFSVKGEYKLELSKKGLRDIRGICDIPDKAPFEYYNNGNISITSEKITIGKHYFIFEYHCLGAGVDYIAFCTAGAIILRKF